MATATAGIGQAALEYAERGWQVLRLHSVRPDGSCSCGADCSPRNRGKHPDVGLSWQTKATSDTEIVGGWWDDKPTANVGVALGPSSGIIDIEFDTDEGRKTADRLFGECYTPTFKSGKSVHRLFLWRDDLPNQSKTDIAGLEIRGPGGQSVFPPSKHPSGAFYQWIPGLSPEDVDVQPVPDEVMALLWNSDFLPINGDAKPKEHWERVLSGSGEGSRNADMASLIGKLLRSMADLETEATAEIAWLLVRSQNQLNSPPLDEKELRRTFLSILKKEQHRRITADAHEMLNPPAEVVVDRDGEKKDSGCGQWRLVIVQADPRRYELYAPQFGKSKGGCIRLTAAQFCSFSALRVQALEQAEVFLPQSVSKEWSAKDGIASRLVASAEGAAGDATERRDAAIAERLLREFHNLREIDPSEGAKVDPIRGSRLPDGTVVFPFTHIWESMNLSADKVTRNELSGLLREVGAIWHRRSSGEEARCKSLSREAIQKLRSVAEAQDGANSPPMASV